MNVRTRMAPSPTGDMHVGSMATLLKNYAFARKNKGQFLLRIEDTDKVREVEDGINKILTVIKNYGLDWDEGPAKDGKYGPYIQSERLELYQKYAKQLVEDGKAYYCFCSKERLEQVREQQQANHQPPKYDRHCLNLSKEEVATKLANGEQSVIRLKVPDNLDITFNDWIRGDITFNSSQVDDQVLLKSDGYPTYHLAVVVDDHLMEITHIMRAEEWISSTPKHILLYGAFGWEPPIFAHLPVFLNPDGKGKMSKRKGMVGAQSFLDRGYLPEAMLNFMMILGWSPKDQREIITLDEYIAEFDPRDLSPKAVAFDINKLNWLNGVYIRNLSRPELKDRLKPFVSPDFPQEIMDPVLDLINERLVTLADFNELTDFFYQDPVVDPKMDKGETPELVKEQLTQTIALLNDLPNWQHAELETAIRTLQETKDWKKRQYFMMLRRVVSGRIYTPPLFEMMQVIGQASVIRRLTQLLNAL